MFSQQLLLLAVQVLILGSIVALGAHGAKSVLVRFFNPGCWFVLFYLLWFLLPQCASMAHGNALVEYIEISDQSWVLTQLYLAGFCLAIFLGMLAVRVLLQVSNRNTNVFPFRESLSRFEYQILILFYVAGAAATLYLGRKLMQSDGFRSELVKSTSGQLLTILMYYGTFAMAVLLGRGLFERRMLQVLLAGGILGSAIFFTGARGRLLWPIAIALVYTFCRSNRVRWFRIATFAAVGLFALLVFDPIFMSLREGLRHWSWAAVWERVDVADLYIEKRNFDGFSNFAVISTYDSIAYEPKLLLTGARDTFMHHYFPGILERGVGFGTTFPGMFWLSGGLYGLLLGGLGYGVLLGLLDFGLRRIRREPLFWSYCFAMTWLCAVGGNFQESLDKMIAVASPGFVWLVLAPRETLSGEDAWEEEEWEEDDWDQDGYAPEGVSDNPDEVAELSGGGPG
ncbi:hypothetical protein FYK55_24575 [Roseiconus nitratireducens]|uniref:Oligosaccharide repeat unit polymerase n=1 Tax=Roseiconus nitratireducens TaxID=2605748 RepID=A0A5M6CVP1_9BACT|nr:hypothetical protein [Roseiconus nitratireducens]KAA5539291.1 hypothetical protein FYK55_24575 [Roseiconus nitratireducens]